MRRIARAVPLIAASALLIGRGTVAMSPATFAREIPWHGNGVWLKVDTHTHTQFSDGSRTIDDVVVKAKQFGCDAVAITDHADSNLRGASPEYFDALESARTAHPGIIVLGGVEWNLPPWNGNEHATVLVAPAVERSLLIFKKQFDDLNRSTHTASLAADGLKWLADLSPADQPRPVVTFEHPSRADEHSIENVENMASLRAVNDLVVGFAGAPGHQGTKPTGSYGYKEHTIDRWDPVAARVGDAWDTLLARGLDIWAAYAPSDFHENNLSGLADYWPGEFAETWVYAPERSAGGVLRALRAGSFFADHGRIVREVELQAEADGLPRSAGAGEAIAVTAGDNITARVSFIVPPTAWRPGPNHVDLVELIGIDQSGARVVAQGTPAETGPALTTRLQVPPGGLVIRARGFTILETKTRLAFYTNPIRIIAQ